MRPGAMYSEHGLGGFRFAVEGVGLVFVGIFGIIGNISTILWFSRKLIQKNFHQLMLTLALCDLLYVILSIFLFGIPSIFMDISKARYYNNLVPIFLPLAQISLTGSIYLTLAIAVERYTTVCHPFFKISHVWASWMYILPILMFAVIYNAPKFFELTVITEVANSTLSSEGSTPAMLLPSSPVIEEVNISRIAPTSLRLNPLYIKIYLIYSNLFIHGIIPLLLLIFLNIAIYRQIREYQAVNTVSSSLHHREVRLAQVSIGIVAVFIICHSVKWVPNIYELLQVEQTTNEEKEEEPWPVWVEYVTCLSHLFTTLNSSVNFYIYVFKHFKRDSARQSFTRRRTGSELKEMGPRRQWSTWNQKQKSTCTVIMEQSCTL